jgi:tyrosinase
MLESYKIAIRKMLDLPPEDPRNWYRNALVHTLDCPHGNWWFVVWHRAYLGWFEQTCRELSGNPEFAFPYWDWTQEPVVPPAMFEDVLTPNNEAYIETFADFQAKFDTVVTDFWNGLSSAQFNQLLVRGYRFPADLWFDVQNYPMFFQRPNARGLTPEQPEFDAVTKSRVSLSTILNALAPRDFITFGSPKTTFHSGLTGFGVLEGQPHNRVHNCVGGFYMTPPRSGFMQDNLSPVDPLFFLHHANIDRLWDVWTRKQAASNSPTLPEGNDLSLWSRENFLFYSDSQGKPVTKVTAGDYAEIGDFDYDYQPGSGEEVVPVAVAAGPAAGPVQSFSAELADASSADSPVTAGDVQLPPELLQPSDEPTAPRLFAKVTVAVPPLAHARDFRVLVNAPAAAAAEAADADLVSPHDAGSFSMFGRHIIPGPITVTVPLAEPLAALGAADTLDAQAPLNIQVVPVDPAVPQPATIDAHEMEPGIEVLSIVVEAH